MSGERFTLDTNILVYAVEDVAGDRQRLAREITRAAALRDCRLTLQAVSEFYAATTRKRRLTPSRAAAAASGWLALFPAVEARPAAVRAALGMAMTGRASYWDALLACTAAEGGCTAILTEDLADGTTFGGLRVINPFGPAGLSPAAAALLA